LKALKPFNIPFVGLSNGKHEFSFELNEDFFDCFDNAPIENAKLEANLILNKKNNMLDLDFFIKGQIESECDRCLEAFWMKIDIHRVLYVKFGEHREEQSDEIVIIPATESHFDVSQYFYEFAILGIPARKVHEENSVDQKECDPQIIQQLEKYMPGKGNKKENDSSGEATDSRWDALKNLKFN
jgi:uncharacterized metal-binding protein YceD (DUF177 family)